MAITFVGMFRPAPGWPQPADLEHQRGTGENLTPAFRQKVREFPSKLPPTCKLIGTWTISPSAGGVTVVEAESYVDLEAINTHYRGYLVFDWHPTMAAVPRD